MFMSLWVLECQRVRVGYLQRVEVRQPNTVPPAQVPSKVIVADIDGLQVPRLVPEEVQHINSLSEAQASIFMQ